MIYTKQIGLSDLGITNYKLALCNFDNNIVVGGIQKGDISLIPEMFPVRTSVMIFIIVKEGTLLAELDYTAHSMNKDAFIIILPEHIVQKIEVSDDFKAHILIVDQQYFSSVEENRRRIYHASFLNIRRNPGLLLSEKEVSVVSECYERIKQKIIQQGHHHREEIIKIHLIECMLEVENILIEHDYGLESKEISRQEYLMYNFFQLLQENGKQEHQVMFYADKLSVTSQYLASVLRQLTGKSTRDWIAEALIIEAKILLKYSEQSMQQITDTLNFCDPSAFGKFFRSQTGITPFQYRKQYLTNSFGSL
ncbi:AraC family transcriptional activator of pobA [Dysgonomonas sp. PFB1-18]|uniref:AraC family transcriptional regulator n=1 Tax=unclassified Dysgonomonas TaxID=2630389 RepID=UPI0024730C58|nr:MULTISPECIES: helix-turn-helix domain-containing protein [unclassified Dysgonomonas]MDH6308779.1 AraC family transcriptional activator of pobA [Dysgonomonas sp. PF1-14]MDH6338524.1 AraC family transcriptional activator of pobA [Dysgonomonas sp. PF1-16]MDH6380028.1 AraC family transcriptional activator of pobA [Dysgonomonas sp. PFB1-18]MDH6397352.1 AraC family transcriptional activator of pobA [Dysgonomonas sp. PF1-23]